MKRKVLYVVHNHPVVRPGGAEAYALEVYRAMRSSTEIEPILVARTGPSGDVSPPRHAGAPFSTVGDDPNQYFVFTETHGLRLLLRHLPRQEPLHHLLRGLPAHLQAGRRALPAHALHRVRHPGADAPAAAGDTDRLHPPRVPADLPPGRPARTHRLRGTLPRALSAALQRVLSGLDAAELLPARPPDQGPPVTRGPVPGASTVPAGALRRLGNPAREADVRGLRPDPAEPVREQDREPAANRLGFFGQISPYKGVDVLLQAMPASGRAGA